MISAADFAEGRRDTIPRPALLFHAYRGHVDAVAASTKHQQPPAEAIDVARGCELWRFSPGGWDGIAIVRDEASVVRMIDVRKL
jgi:hypothetical protein